MENSRYADTAAGPLPPAETNTDIQEYEMPISHMDPLLDEFAQTRPPDDLFDDDFTPITHSEAVLDVPIPTPVQVEPLPKPAQFLREPPKGPRGRGGRKSAGRISPPKVPVEVSPKVSPKGNGGGAAAAAEPATPKPERKEGAVRGDRSGTGGIKKAKLTDTELAQKLEAMSLKNAALHEAHARTQRDVEAFEAREAIASERRKEERQNRQQMMGEREKNRQRKLQAVGGREWDVEKKEEDFRNADADRKAKRGAHGGIAGSRYAPAVSNPHPAQARAQGQDLIEGFRGRGNAERGRGRGRGRGGRGRGGGGNENGPSDRGGHQQIQALPKTSDFPDLPQAAPGASKTEPVQPAKILTFPIKPKPKVEKAATEGAKQTKPADEKPKLSHRMSFGLSSPIGEKKSWADQVEGTA